MPDDVVRASSYAARRPTMKDVAVAAGVSKALVSMIFRDVPGPNPATKAHVLTVAENIGYRRNRAASLLGRRRTKHLGVAMALGSAFHAELAEEVQAAADAHGYEVVLSTTTRTHSERHAIETLLEFRCEALLLFGPESPTAQLAALAEELPVVAIGRRMSRLVLDVVRAADADGMRTVVDHLVELGHRRVLHVTGGRGTIAGDRRRGYEKAMRAHRLHAQMCSVDGGMTERDGAIAAEAMLAAPQLPSAVVAFNDECAVGVLDTLRRNGIAVPESVSVAGYDDSPIARLAPIELTTVSQEPQQQAVLAVKAAVEQLDGLRDGYRDTVIRPRLVVRRTTGPPLAGSR